MCLQIVNVSTKFEPRRCDRLWPANLEINAYLIMCVNKCTQTLCLTEMYFASLTPVLLHEHFAWNDPSPLLEIDRIQKGETKKEAEAYLDLFTTKNIKLKERVLIPVKQYPKVRFLCPCFFFSVLLPSWFNLSCSQVSIIQSHGVTWESQITSLNLDL